MKKIKYCIALQIEFFQSGILLHQSNYTEKILKRFSIDKANPLITPMVARSMNVEKIPFRYREDNKEVLGPEVLYLSAIGALMYLTSYTRSDLSLIHI